MPQLDTIEKRVRLMHQSWSAVVKDQDWIMREIASIVGVQYAQVKKIL